MLMSDYIEGFVDCFGFDTLVVWADILKVPHDEGRWIDDNWFEKEDDLRVAVAEAMEKLSSPTLLGVIMADALDNFLTPNPNERE